MNRVNSWPTAPTCVPCLCALFVLANCTASHRIVAKNILSREFVKTIAILKINQTRYRQESILASFSLTFVLGVVFQLT